MPLSTQNDRIFLLGPGALGCGFATFLQARHNVTLLGGFSDPRRYLWQNQIPEFTSQLLAKCGWEQDTQKAFEQQKNWSEEIVYVFSFLPTGHEDVAFEVCEKFASKKNRHHLIFCSNGVVPWSKIQQLCNRNPNVSLSRMIFFAGFSRNKKNFEISYNGGVKILGGSLFEGASGDFLALQSLIENAEPKNSIIQWPPFEVNWVLDIRIREFQKLYVNWIFAIGAGPRNICNESVVARVTFEFLVAWATFFQRYLSEKKENGSFLLHKDFVFQSIELVKETGHASAQNLNSFSKAKIEGDSFPFGVIWGTIQDMRSAFGIDSNLKWIDDSMEAISKDWEVSKSVWK